VSKLYRVECYTCDTEFEVNCKDIRIDLDEVPMGEDDYGWHHDYLVACPTCQDVKSVYILDPSSHGCCLQECYED
jgi:hypothetical protein